MVHHEYASETPKDGPETTSAVSHQRCRSTSQLLLFSALAALCACAPEPGDERSIHSSLDGGVASVVQGLTATCPLTCPDVTARGAAAAQTIEVTSSQVLVSAFESVKPSGKIADGTDDAVAIQAAILAAKGRPVVFPPGDYLQCCPVRATLDPDAGKDQKRLPLTVIGTEGAFSYFGNNPLGGDRSSQLAADLPVTIRAHETFPADWALFDFRYQHNVSVTGIEFELPAAHDLTSAGAAHGIELGQRQEGAMYSNHQIERCNFEGGLSGIRGFGAGLLRVRNNNFSAQFQAGIFLERYCGDSDLEGNYLNGSLYLPANQALADVKEALGHKRKEGEPLGTGGGTRRGVGIYVGLGSSNLNIRGGKIEHNLRGIVIEQASGINISGVNFDYNPWGHILVRDDSTDSLLPVRSININANRFLAGGFSRREGDSHIMIQVFARSQHLTHHLYANIVGNSFRKGSATAVDQHQYKITANPNPEQVPTPMGPTYAAVRVDSSGLADVRVNVAGNDMVDGAMTNSIAAYGPGIVVQDIANQKNLPNYAQGLKCEPSPAELCAPPARIVELNLTRDGSIELPGLPSTPPPRGSRRLWYDPNAGNVVKFMPDAP